MHPDANPSAKLDASLNTKSNTKPSAKKVALIYTGGTLGMELKANKLVASSLDASLALPDAWLVENNISIDYVEKKPIDSANADLKFYLKLAKLLRELAEDHDSLVVIQGTDTMEFSASAISFLCRDIKKPIVFTGAQLPISYNNSDGQDNIQDAIIWSITQGVAGVNIGFGGRLLKGINSRKFSTIKFAAFANFSTGFLGEVQKDPNTNSKNYILFNKEDEELHKALNPNIEQILDIFCTRINTEADLPHTSRLSIFPSLNEEDLISSCKDADLIFIEGYGSGTLPELTKFFAHLQQKIAQGAKVVLLSQALDFGIYESEYATNLQSIVQGIFSGANMTFATAYAKALFLWCAEIKDSQKWQELWQTDFAGEFTQNQPIAS